MDKRRDPTIRNITRHGATEILYVYGHHERHFQTLLAFVLSGLQLGQNIILIESSAVYNMLSDELADLLSVTQRDATIHYIMNDNAVSYNHHTHRIVDKMNVLIQNISDNERLRVWSHVDSVTAQTIVEMHVHDDLLITAVDENETSARLQNYMLRYHQYLMTDIFCTLSPFFHNSSSTSNLHTEVDLDQLKSEFISVISHEVRNPVTVIKGYATLLKKYKDAFSSQDEGKLQTIIDCADIIDEEMQNIMYTEQFLSGKDVWKKQVIHISPVLDQVLQFMEIKSKLQNIHFSQVSNLNGDETMPSNELALRLILSNVIANAIKYSDENGVVHVDIQFNHHGLSVVVEDDGLGMSPEQVGKLFRKYGKMARNKEGLGLGLYTVKSLVDKLGGHIDVISEESIGTTVSIWLPPH